jgi:hypothetical protein
MGFFIRIVQNNWGISTIPALAGAAALPLLAAAAYWALFSQRTVIGFTFFVITLAPALVSMITAFLEKRR